MKNKILILLLLGFVTLLNGQDSLSTAEISGRNTLMFQVQTLNLIKFKGAAIAYKYHFENRDALRFRIAYRRFKDDDSRKVIVADTLQNGLESNSETNFLNLVIDYLFYSKVSDDITFYYGAGLYGGFNLWDTDNHRGPQNSNSYDHVGSSKQYLGGINGIIGADWFLRDNFSLTFEYTISAYYRYTENTNEYLNIDDSRNRKSESYTSSIGNPYVTLGISWYF